MFSASLRKRPLWRTVGPLLASLATLRLKESSIRTHDFEIPYVQGTRSSSLLTLLFTPASLQTAARTDTIARIDRFYALTGGRDIVIALLLSENEEEANRPGAQVDMRPLLELQVLLLEHLPTSIPIITVSNPTTLLSSLESYTKAISSPPRLARPPPAPISLLAHATVTAPHRPLQEHTVNVLSDLFPDLRSLGLGVRTEGGKVMLREYLDAQIVESIEGFWDGEENGRMKGHV